MGFRPELTQQHGTPGEVYGVTDGHEAHCATLMATMMRVDVPQDGVW